MPEMSGDTDLSQHQQETSTPIWIDLPSADREVLGDLRAKVGLPLELITYCLLDQPRPRVIPCDAWLYCAWQVPVFGAGRDEVSFRFVEIKACLGPAAIVTVHNRVRGAKRPVASLVPDADALVRERPGNLLVTLVERVADAYVSAQEELAVDPVLDSQGRGRRRRQARTAAETQLRRHVRAHRDAVQKLIVRGQRWLDLEKMERLKRVADRLADLASDPREFADMADNAPGDK